MSAPTQPHTFFDVDRYTRAVESADADALLSQYGDDAEMEMFDRRTPPSAPMILHGRDEIGAALRDLNSHEMTHEVLQCVADSEHVAYTERCTYPDGNKVMSMTMLDLRDGRIAHQSMVQAWDEEDQGTLQVVGFDDAEMGEEFEKGRIDVVRIGGQGVARMTFEPGWRWSEHVAPLMGTETCMKTHCAYIVSGALRCRMDDGTERDVHAGEVASVPPGHDAWVLGDEPFVAVDWRAPNAG
ncbi:nuclear transport factor 2 family protein [Nocardiopsis halotolerans]|uniref:nuclear transport factor 2 family protein n=1 Tax=Nocardiopsis halotolerans TaxID=124252 RepID=UPI00034DF1E0|nr:nuclear transport factor 2 family protein [Nocardiopsis halotolerans]